MRNESWAPGTRTAIKIGVCAILVAQVLVNPYLYYHLHIVPGVMRQDPRVIPLITAAMLYLLCSRVPEVLQASAGIRRQVIYFADWSLAYGIWEFLAGFWQGGAVILFTVGAVLAVMAVKDAIRIGA